MIENIKFRQHSPSDLAGVRRMIEDFYREAPEGKSMTANKIDLTFERLRLYPESGTFMVFEEDGELAGYALLINFWSNEYGGIILVIDELYITPAHRGKGLGKKFFDYLIEHKPNNWVALELEVLPYNQRALQLYEKIGFKKSDRSYLLLE
jgi:GNAT superfamily N-acetyltransferase